LAGFSEHCKEVMIFIKGSVISGTSERGLVCEIHVIVTVVLTWRVSFQVSLVSLLAVPQMYQRYGE
jgi:hypothetical protein